MALHQYDLHNPDPKARRLEPLDIIISSTVAMGTTYALLRIDRLRIPSQWQQRGWNTATTGAAIFTFSPLCIIAHFWVTRRSALGILKGFLALLLILLVQVVLLQVYENMGVFAFLAVTLLGFMPLCVPLPLLFGMWLSTS